MKNVQKLCVALSLLMTVVGCGKHQVAQKQTSGANTAPADTKTPAVEKTKTDATTDGEEADDVLDLKGKGFIVGGETTFGSKAFRVLVNSPKFTDKTIGKLLALASPKFKKKSFDPQNFLSVMVKVDGGKAKLSKGFADLITVVDEISKADGTINITTPTDDQSTKMLSEIKIGKTKIDLATEGDTRGVVPTKPDVTLEPLEDKSYLVEMNLDGDTLKQYLPMFDPAPEDAAKLNPLTFDLAKSSEGYGTEIKIAQHYFKDLRGLECLIMHVEQKASTNNFAITNFANFTDDVFDFSHLKLEDMQKLPKDVVIPSTIACFFLVSSVEQKNNGIILTYSGLNIKVIDSAAKAAPVVDGKNTTEKQEDGKPAAVKDEKTNTAVKPIIAITSPVDQSESENTITVTGTATAGAVLAVTGDLETVPAGSVMVGADGKFAITDLKLKDQDSRTIKITATKDGITSEAATVTLKKKSLAAQLNEALKDNTGGDNPDIKITTVLRTPDLVLTASPISADDAKDNLVTITGTCSASATLTLLGDLAPDSVKIATCGTDGTYSIQGIKLVATLDKIKSGRSVKVLESKSGKTKSVNVKISPIGNNELGNGRKTF